jgi:hypothetical protein
VGRLYPHVSSAKGSSIAGLSMLSRKIRSFLVEDIYLDIDLVKCHWYILQYLFITHGCDVSLIDELIAIYPDILSFISNEVKKPKDAIFSILYSSPTFISTLSKRILYKFPIFQQIHDIVYKNLIKILMGEHKPIWDLVLKNDKNPKNHDGSFLSSVCQDLERKMIVDIIDVCQELEITVDTVIHDGS